MNYEKTKELAKSGHQLAVLLGTQNGMHEAASLVQRMAGHLDLLAVVLREKTKISDELLEALLDRAEPMFYVSYKAAKRLLRSYTRFATMTTDPKAGVSLPLYIRDVRTIVEMGRAAGFHPRYEIPFEGDLHNALADAKHQVKYVSTIWQRFIPATSNNI
ncbi:3'-5' exonuclease [Cronobacter turicensis]|uniref:3'-5' exonuclease n=1 Tax=Cronobacter TaxID=413496 RepID=UPI001F25687B|nr:MULTISPECIES: 3'-5' exonuclease [Cronobacter]MDI6431301.1 3'-5' exonuclease [Cronobacter turicensis]MDI6477335.1 3'-5' exonuclease [Cronobacter dublinensis]